MSIRNASLALVTVLLAFTTGCGTAIRTRPLNPPPRVMKPRSFDQVKVFRTLPRRPYVAVAELSAEQQSEFSVHTGRRVFNNMRAYAARMGCDGIIVRNQTRRMVPVSHRAAFVLKGFRATCIVFK